MWGLEWLRERASDMRDERLAQMSPAELAEIQAEEGECAAVEASHDVWFSVSNETFRAGLFQDAAEAFAQRQRATHTLAGLLARAGDTEGAKEQSEELARQAWAVGDLELFARYVREGCDPRAKTSPRLDIFPALFMSWAVLGRTFHPEHWRARFEEAVSGERQVLKQSWDGEQLKTAERVLIESRRAEANFWLGNFSTALEQARESLEGFKHWHRARPKGMEFPHKRVWRNRVQGLVSLLAGREDEAQGLAAIDAFTKALVDSVLMHDVDWKDLVILHVIARAWRDPQDPTVVDFQAAFPHLSHLLKRERSWEEESADDRGEP